MSNNISDNNIPLVVDVDGTLIKTDLLFEAIILLIKKNPIHIFKCLFWLIKGKAYFKSKVFGQVRLDYQTLPFNLEVLSFLQNEFASGRTIILATASPVTSAVEIAKLQPIFSEVYGTENNINLKGANKQSLLVNKFGTGNFDYIGDSMADIEIFASCRYSYLVNANKSLQNKVARISKLKFTWYAAKPTVKDYIKAIRAYQWIKNLLIFVPLVTSHTLHDKNLFVSTCFAFIAFSLVASAGYLLNDLLDINSDRRHPRKKFRPLASGKLAIIKGLLLAIIFLMGSIILAASINLKFLTVLLFYFSISFSYSLFFKKVVLYDVFILAMLYSLRVFAGGVVIDISLSFWLIAFSAFLFLSLAFVKRYSELMQIVDEPDLKNRGRGYAITDLNLLQVMGVVSGFSAVVVFSLYINSPEVAELYAKPKILWVISFLFLFWISRIWFFTAQGKMTDDPIVFAIKDITSYFVFLITAILIIISI